MGLTFNRKGNALPTRMALKTPARIMVRRLLFSPARPGSGRINWRLDVKTGLWISFLAGSCLAVPVRVTVDGVVSAIAADSLEMADSLGLSIGSPVRYELELDYDKQPTLIYDGITQTWNDTTRSNGDSLDYFTANLVSGRIIPVRHAIAGILDAGVFVVSGPTSPQLGLISHLLGPINTYYSFGLFCQEPTGRLTKSTRGQITESFVINNATVFSFNADIRSITLEGPVAARSPQLGKTERPALIPGGSAYRFRGQVFSINGRIR